MHMHEGVLGPLPFRSVADLLGKRVLVVGLGTKRGGENTARWLATHQARVTVTDLKSEHDLQSSLGRLRGLPIHYTLGENRMADVDAAEMVVRNPAVPLDAPVLRHAARRGVPVVMDTTIFFAFCPAPIAGITGTRGKSTTTAVAGEILRRGRPETVVAGNIEQSPLAELDRITPTTPVVLELSSWQLEGIAPLCVSPHWGVLTTILQDHLNRYHNMEAYVAAKETVVKYQKDQDVAILPFDEPSGERFAGKTPAQQRWFGDFSDFTVLRNTVKRRDREKLVGLFRVGDRVVRMQEGLEEVVLQWDELGGTGDHTKRNMLAGALLALEMGAPLADVRATLRAFRGIPNRLEVIREFADRAFVNDTAATTPEAVVAALHAFQGRKVVLITGGTDKNLDYTALATELIEAPNLRAVVLLAGSATEKLCSVLRNGRAYPVVRTMGEAVARAWDASQSGDVMLLSPGAASFELFRDEFDRGDQFREAVNHYASSA